VPRRRSRVGNMGKATNYRVIAVSTIKYVVVALPCLGGLLFLLGSFTFWPGSSHDATNAGATCFLIGSLCYWAAPFLDFWELTHNLDNLADRPLDLPVDLVSPQHAQAAFNAALYEQLYKAHVLRLQRVNSIIFMAGGAFFVGGSALFYPAMEHLIMHGGWLYITGCILVLLAALLGVLTAYEMRKTAAPSAAGRWSDEEATMLSCGAYVVGNVTFIVGSIMFFPRILEAGGPVIRLSAVWLFVLGSCVFLAGALIDLLVVLRAAAAERGTRRRARLDESEETRSSSRAQELVTASEQKLEDSTL
jgi:hypothetical protein